MRQPIRPFALTLALFSLSLSGVGAGCAHGSGTGSGTKMSFEEAGLLAPVEPEGPAPPPVKHPNPRKVATEKPSGPPIDATLLRFTLEEQDRRHHSSAQKGFPDDEVEAWRGLAQELDQYLQRPLPQTPLFELIRARITVETELEYDHRRWGDAPGELEELLGPRLARFGARIAASRGLGRRTFVKAKPPPLRWPLAPAGISSPFGWRLHPIDGHRKMHYGVDLVADRGRVVGAVAAGYVTHAGWTAGYGLMVEIRHSGDLTSRYSHLSKLLCTPGDQVEREQPLGLVGATGKATGPHLHLEVWLGGRAVDPLPLLGEAPLGYAGG